MAKQVVEQKPELTELQFEILRYAVTLARQDNIRSVAFLRKRLEAQWPKKPRSIQKALEFWSAHEQRKRRN